MPEIVYLIFIVVLLAVIVFLFYKQRITGNVSDYGEMKLDLHDAGWPETPPPVKATEIDGVWELIDYFQNGESAPSIVAQKYVIYRQCGFQLITIGGVPYSLYYYFLDEEDERNLISFKGPDGNSDDTYAMVGDKMYLGSVDSPNAIYRRIS